MLKKLSHRPEVSRPVRIADAPYPVVFPAALEYNAPVHGTWNIVHIGMQVPEAVQIYVCAENCMRGVVMTANEMGLGDRFCCVTMSERDMLVGNIEEITIRGVSDAIEKRGSHPPMVMLFTVCAHVYLGADLDYIYRKLSERYPDIFFARCYMDPINQRTGPTPEMKLRLAMLDPIAPLPKDNAAVNLLGCDIPQGGESDLLPLLRENGFRVRQLADCKSYSDFLALGDAGWNLCAYPTGEEAVRALAERLGTPYLYLSQPFTFAEIVEKQNALRTLLGLPCEDFTAQIEACKTRLAALRKTLAGQAVCLDYTATPRPVSMARLLLEHGIRLEKLYLDAVGPEEADDFAFLRAHFPDLMLHPTLRPEQRAVERPETDVLAIGQKAAFYENTPYFVNMVEGGGLWGFAGILGLCGRIEQALLERKNTRDIVMRKGLGCDSLCCTPDWREKP